MFLWYNAFREKVVCREEERMKILWKNLSYEAMLKKPSKKRKKPKKCSAFYRLLLKIICTGELKKVHFKAKKVGMERLGKKEPCLILMNHCSWIDLKIAATIMNPRPVNIVCTTDALLGKGWIMRQIGCIATDKYVTDMELVKDIIYAIKNLKSSVLMFPEAGFSSDGKSTVLPKSLGKLVKLLNVPLVMIESFGAFARDPLYNSFQKRKVDVSAEVRYLLSPAEIQQKTYQEINQIIEKQFEVDYFRWQKENKIAITEPFRADYLNKILYKCPHCLQEGKMLGKGTTLKCTECGKEYFLTEYGELQALSGDTEFPHIPDWSDWQRSLVAEEVSKEDYKIEIPVKIGIVKNDWCIYVVGNGTLTHTREGFKLTGCDGKLNYEQSSSLSYSVCADYNWYEREDVVCIGTNKTLYFCFPTCSKDIAFKIRLAVEEIYKQLNK